MKPEELHVVIPRKEGIQGEADPVLVWPLVEQALNRIGADPAVRDAAYTAMRTSQGIIALGNYLNSEAKRIRKMDYTFKVPMIVAAAEAARKDGGADSLYCPEEGCVYFETDTDQYSFHVHKDWTVNWPSVVDEVVPGYDWSGEENQTWALEKLLEFLDTDLSPYLGSEAEE